MSYSLNETRLDRWRGLLSASKTDQLAWSKWSEENKARAVIRGQMAEFLSNYLAGDCDTESLRETFDCKTRKEWSSFGFKGMSGAMFLNMLVKHIPDRQALTAQLRAVLPVPRETSDGRQRMQDFSNYLQSLISQKLVSRMQIQPARLPFFVSAWWHVQDTELWPVFYESGRNTLEREGEFEPSRDVVKDYFAFRERFLSLASALQLSVWDFEHLVDWHDKHPSGVTEGAPHIVPADPKAAEMLEEEEDGEPAAEPQESAHNQVQWLLATIGQKLGCKVWIAANDHKREWNGQRLGELSIKELPTLGLDAESQKIIRLIDVVWIKGANQVTAAFEIEHTTSIFSGILRMSDLAASSPNLNFPLYLVAPEKRMSQVRAQLSRPTFQALELHRRCGFFSDESLIEKAEAIMQWATTPAAIDKLAAKVDDAKSL